MSGSSRTNGIMEKIPRFTRTRIAPTPSGFLHLGNVFSFALTATLARKSGAEILLRIDDMDRDRVTRDYIEDIFETLKFLEIPWDTGPRDADEFEKSFSQRHRLPLYEAALESLKDNVLACTCSRAQLAGLAAYNGACLKKPHALDTPDAAWRLNTTMPRTLAIRQWPDRMQHVTLPEQMQYFVVRKKDGFPAYQLTSVVDDLHYGVDFIVRGEDLWPSTLAQLYLAQALPVNVFASTVFYHHALLPDDAGQKLSKSAGATSIRHWRKEGKRPAEVYQAIGRMLNLSHEVDGWQGLAEAALTRVRHTDNVQPKL